MRNGISISAPPEMERVEVRTQLGTLLFIISTTGESFKKKKKKSVFKAANTSYKD